MQIWRIRVLTAASLASVVLLSGCSPFVSVKDIANDKPAYLATNFDADSLPTSVREKLPAAGKHPLPFKILTMSGTVSGHVGAVAVSNDFKDTLINAKDTGLVQQLSEVSANDVPHSATFSLSYLNLFNLKTETAVYSRTMALVPAMVHDADNNQFVFEAPKEDTTYVTTFETGTTIQITDFRTAVTSCHTGHFYPASQINAVLTGKALDFDCEETKDGIIQNKARRTYLTEYGIGLTRSIATSTLKFDWTYREIEKDGESSARYVGKAISNNAI
ncbi:hypothetical protein [Paraburkholderia tropica]|uniref:hypothetical protein n=1 Tax=Paraburkholderia tropica TaxID=92647 RepID=UPI001590136C|nr:hypothetical protein [Paraburkholderia tropica]